MKQTYEQLFEKLSDSESVFFKVKTVDAFTKFTMVKTKN